jgi:hypothetical protein
MPDVDDPIANARERTFDRVAFGWTSSSTTLEVLEFVGLDRLGRILVESAHPAPQYYVGYYVQG